MNRVFSSYRLIVINIKARLSIFRSLLFPKSGEDPWMFRQQLDILRTGGSLEPDPGLVGDKEYLQNCIINRFGTFDKLKGLGAGCGTGRIEAWLSREGAEIYYLDHIVEALQISQIHAKRVDSIGHFILGDLERIPIMDRSFDFIYSGGVLEHFANPSKALREYYRVIKPNGIIIVSVPNLVGINAIFGLKPLIDFFVRKRQKGDIIEQDFSARKFKKSIELAGFRCLNINPAFFNTFDCFPFFYVRWFLAVVGVFPLYCKFLNAFGQRYPGIAFGYSFMIALAERPEC